MDTCNLILFMVIRVFLGDRIGIEFPHAKISQKKRMKFLHITLGFRVFKLTLKCDKFIKLG